MLHINVEIDRGRRARASRVPLRTQMTEGSPYEVFEMGPRLHAVYPRRLCVNPRVSGREPRFRGVRAGLRYPLHCCLNGRNGSWLCSSVARAANMLCTWKARLRSGKIIVEKNDSMKLLSWTLSPCFRDHMLCFAALFPTGWGANVAKHAVWIETHCRSMTMHFNSLQHQLGKGHAFLGWALLSRGLRTAFAQDVALFSEPATSKNRCCLGFRGGGAFAVGFRKLSRPTFVLSRGSLLDC